MRRPSVRTTAATAVVAATAALALAGGALVAAQAAPTDGCTVTYTVGATWRGGFLADVTVLNLGAAVNGWKVTWSFGAGPRVLQSWGARATQSGTQVTAGNVGWNAALASGGSVRFGFVAATTGSSADSAPSSFSLNGIACTAPSDPTPAPTGASPTTPAPTGTSPTGTAGPTTTTTPTPTATAPTTGPTSTVSGPWPPSATFANPVIWQDFADGDVVRVGDAYYYSASNMHFSPGAPILRSYDLVHWEVAGHSVPRLEFGGAGYDLGGGRAYIRGTWASFFNYRKSEKQFYWGGCVDGRTHLYTAAAVEGPWRKHATISNCYYDAGMVVDDDDTMYVSYGSTSISVAQLSKDGTSQVRAQKVFDAPNGMYIEGSRFYKYKGNYYILVTRPANAEFVLKSSSPWGPYTMQTLVDGAASPVPGAGAPHQGGIVQTAAGDWYYMAFIDAYPGGRVPVLAPMTWSADGWPRMQLTNNVWSANGFAFPNVPRPAREVKPLTGTDTFSGTTLAPDWEWNHNPDDTKWSSGNGLTLRSATVTDDLYAARNTLTRRILGPSSTATISLDFSGMKDGDRAGLAMLRDSSAWIGLVRDGTGTRLAMVNGITMDRKWNTTAKGTVVATAPVTGNRIWLRVNADIRPGPGRQATFSYSTDGSTFTRLGPGFTMGNDWPFFMGYRFALFSYATKALGGAVKVERFDLSTP